MEHSMTADAEEGRSFHSDPLPEETAPDSAAVPRSYCGAPLCTDLDDLDAQVAFLGVPSDMGSLVAGPRYGPNGIRDARVYSYAAPATGETALGYYDVETERQRLEGVTMADCGDVTIWPGNVERNYWRVTRAVRRIVSRGSLLVVVGGDHSVTGAVGRGFDSYGEMDVVHFDAHMDFHEHIQGILWANGSPIRRLSEYPWVRNISQIGIRNLGGRGRKQLDDAHARGNRIITANQFRQLGPEQAIALVPEADNIYVTIDIDVMDPSLCPGTSVPDAGGFGYLEMRAALQALARRGRIVGIDLVEVAPRLDPTGVTAKIGAQLLIDLLSAVFDNKEK